MSKNKDWNERSVEDSLQQLPPIKDSQSKDELYQSIQKKMNDKQAEDKTPVLNKKKKAWFYPAIATAAAVFLVILIIPSFFNDGQEQSFITSNNSEEAADNGSPAENNNMGIMNDSSESEENDRNMENNSNMGNDSNMENDSNTENDTGEVAEVTEENENVSEADELSKIKYVTIPVPHSMHVDTGEHVWEKVAVFGVSMEATEETGTELEDLIFYGLTSEEFDWGYDLSGQLQSISLNYEESEATLDFAEDHWLMSLTSSQMATVSLSLNEVFGMNGFEIIRFTVNGTPGIDYGQAGPVETLPIISENRGYYLYEAEDGNHYLMRAAAVDEQMTNEEDELLSFEETIDKMRTVEDGAWYYSSIPSNIEFELAVEDKEVYVYFQDQSQLENTKEMELFFESIVLAASDFTFDYVTFEGDSNIEVGSYQLGDRVEVRNISMIR